MHILEHRARWHPGLYDIRTPLPWSRALYTNDHATRIGEARLFFEQLARCLAGPSSSAGTGQPLEMSYVTRAFAMFNSRSAWVAGKQVAALGAAAETSMQSFFYKFLAQFGPLEKRGRWY